MFKDTNTIYRDEPPGGGQQNVCKRQFMTLLCMFKDTNTIYRDKPFDDGHPSGGGNDPSGGGNDPSGGGLLMYFDLHCFTLIYINFISIYKI
jgi:hypothetical protein